MAAAKFGAMGEAHALCRPIGARAGFYAAVLLATPGF